MEGKWTESEGTWRGMEKDLRNGKDVEHGKGRPWTCKGKGRELHSSEKKHETFRGPAWPLVLADGKEWAELERSRK